MPDFLHLHCHTQYSLLDGAAGIPQLMDKAVRDGQKGVALTDHGNMFGAFTFVNEAKKRNLKPIVGCEFYLVEDRHKTSFKKGQGERDVRYHQLMLAKNAVGYRNLSKLCSLGFIDGLYGKFPRIDKELILQYHEGLIATSCCIGAEIPQAILKGDLDGARKKVKWWVDLLGDDFYIEIQRHRGLENIDGLGVSQEDINQTLLSFAKEFNLKVIATNDSHYVEEEDAQPHDVILCVNTGSLMSDEKRFSFSSSDFFFKSKEEMGRIFSDVPESLENTLEIYDKVEELSLARDVLLPNFPLPADFTDQSEYLKNLVFEGAKQKYGEISASVNERLDFELGIIKDMGFDGYFLIVQDFIQAAKDMGVSVGPGRGSAAGSAVSYCLSITNLDPIKYNLLFERFLNPERISMPDIDIDFDDEGRQKVIDWVVDKYGKNQVAQIVTFGSMAARSSVRDVSRVMNLPLPEADKLAKLIPSRQGASVKLKDISTKSIQDFKGTLNPDDIVNVEKLKSIYESNDLQGEVMRIASKVEGSVRNTGIHAAGVIIAPDDIMNHIPVFTSKESNLLITQFDGNVVESAGMLKMDFLGLKTLSIIKDAIENIVLRYGEASRIDPDAIPLDDEKTFELFQRGDTLAIFQFESEGMRKSLKELKPTTIEDLIAMNALYRPGPMDYIPLFVSRKHGREEIKYPHQWLEDILKPTYGIMVYQEQIMQTAQIMADYSLGQADVLRRAMGKKKHKEMDRQREIFKSGAVKKGVDEARANEIFDIMSKFASYGFNRSHAAAYSVLAFQTAYLKTHYPAAFMASVLTHNKKDISKLNFFLRECKRMNVAVLGPDINESQLEFTVNDDGKVRFGLSALKGVGEGPVAEILEIRAEDRFVSVNDMVRRLNIRSVNKKCFESLIKGGALDSVMSVPRSTYFAPHERYNSFLERVIRYGNQFKEDQQKSQNSLFGEMGGIEIPEPVSPEIQPWPLNIMLNHEKEVAGIFLSGHPLDDYKEELASFANCSVEQIPFKPDRKLKFGALVVSPDIRLNRKGVEFARFQLQDFSGNVDVALYKEDFQKHKHLVSDGQVVFVEGKFEKRWSNADYEFRIHNMRQMDAVGHDLTEAIQVFVPLEEINPKMIASIKTLATENKGPHKLKITILDKEEKLSLDTIATKKNVLVGEKLLNEIKEIGLEYKLVAT